MGLTLTTGMPFRILVFRRQARGGGPVLREDGPNLDVQLKFQLKNKSSTHIFQLKKDACILIYVFHLARIILVGITESAYS